MFDIWATSKDPGGTASLLPVVKKLRQRYKVILIVSGKAVEILNEASEDFIVYQSTEKILADYPLPKAFVTSMDSSGSSLGRDFVPLLKGKCPIIALQDTWGAPLLTTWVDKIYRPDFVCVNDELAAKLVFKAWPDFKKEQVLITGYPALDKYSGYDVFAAAAYVRQKLELTEQKPIVFFAGQVQKTGGAFLELVEALNEINRDIYLIPRMHLRMQDDAPEELPLWQKALTNFKSGTLIADSSSCDTPSIIAASTVVVAMYSIVLVEAVALRKQNISLLYPDVGMARYKEVTGGLMNEFPLVELGCSAKASSRQELCDLLKKSFDNELGLEENQKKHFRLDGENTGRIVEFIYRLIGQPHQNY